MKKAVLILILIFPLLGSSAKKPIDVSITTMVKARDTKNLAYYQNAFADGWCDFYKNDETGKYHLHEANISVDIYYDDCAEDSLVYVLSNRPSLFLIKGLKPKTKPVKTLVPPTESVSVTLEEKYSFRFGGKTYTFRSEGDVRTDGNLDDYWYKIEDYKLYLSDGKSEQLITTVPYFGGTSPDILWIGDLDDDGKPDFAVRTETWYEEVQIELYLSSIAEKGELVKLAGMAYHNAAC